MELLEGAPLCDHISSLAERGLKFSEERLWKVFMQLVLALRYLHKEKRVVHRDLSPANLMLSDEDKLTISECSLQHRSPRGRAIELSCICRAR